MTKTQNGSDVALNSWNDVNELLFDFPPSPVHGRYRSSYAFRGLADEAFDLRTSLARMGGPYWELERHLISGFKKYAHLELRDNSSLWHTLSVAQHHGLPTRLLDWTYSPYVALHFATAEMRQFDVDGVIWRVDVTKANQELSDSLVAILDRERTFTFTIDMLDEVVPDLRTLDGFSADPFLVFFEPPSLDDRIVNQFALFSVMSNPKEVLNKWLGAHTSLYRRFVIPASLKWEIRDKLDAANITERMLFPGLDGLSSWLKRWYSPKN